MADEFRIDSHKLIYHPRRVAEWLNAGDDWQRQKKVYPIYMELSPFGGCNHRCVFCALDYMGYKPKSLDPAQLWQPFRDMAAKGVKSIMFGGEGEPLLHKQIGELTHMVKEAGIDVSLTTNGVLLGEAFCQESLGCLSWIKISLNAGTPATYGAVHRTDPADFDKVIGNLRRAVALRKANCTIGVQILLLPENAHEVETLARICRDEVGADYLVVKPYSQHKASITRKYAATNYSQFLGMANSLCQYDTEKFKVIFRTQTMQRAGQVKTYQKCSATPFFWAYLTSAGDIYSCSAYLGDPRFRLGNIYRHSFVEIWEGDRRRENNERVKNILDISECRTNCRMDAANRYLWELNHPHAHANFI